MNKLTRPHIGMKLRELLAREKGNARIGLSTPESKLCIPKPHTSFVANHEWIQRSLKRIAPDVDESIFAPSTPHPTKEKKLAM